MRLTVGMAHNNDFHGAYFSIQSLRMHHADVFDEIVVVDTDPDSGHGAALRGLCANAGARYIARPGGGTASRDVVFREATGDVVVCIDCHVLFPPGALASLKRYFEGHPGTGDLVQGPILWDALGDVSGEFAGATHFDDVWDAQMWGQWGRAWKHPGSDAATRSGGAPPRPLREAEGKAGGSPGVGIPPGQLFAWNKGGPYLLPDYRPLPWAAVTPPDSVRPGADLETTLRSLGCRPVSAADEPFEIPAMGLGMFACRKDAWLGFHPEFRGFGGEEHYIHEKYRQNGRKTVCVPSALWGHRFARPDARGEQAVPYRLSLWDKLHNYVTGFRELGLDLAPVKAHFVGEGKPATEKQWEAVLAGEDPEAVPAAGVGGCGCGGGSKSPFSDVDAWYESAAGTPSDLNEHCPTLRDLARGAATVVEFGTRPGVSTVALLAGRPGTLLSVSPRRDPLVKHLEAAASAAGVEYRFVKADTRSVALPERIDLLFVDTTHTEAFVTAELENAGLKADVIAFHDTEAFGEAGEDGGRGVRHAIRRWCREHREYSVLRHDAHNHGFTVLSRKPEHRKGLPPALKMGWNFLKAVTRDLANGQARVPLEVADARLERCDDCPERSGDRCSACGCYLSEFPDGRPGKVWYASERCPLPEPRWERSGGVEE